jgi:5-methylcytosine-specific restriction endonuclease McrA
MAWPRTSRHERGYGTAHDKMRAGLIREVVTCEECDRQGIVTPGTIADHITPRRHGGEVQLSAALPGVQRCQDRARRWAHASAEGRRHP